MKVACTAASVAAGAAAASAATRVLHRSRLRGDRLRGRSGGRRLSDGDTTAPLAHEDDPERHGSKGVLSHGPGWLPPFPREGDAVHEPAAFSNSFNKARRGGVTAPSLAASRGGDAGMHSSPRGGGRSLEPQASRDQWSSSSPSRHASRADMGNPHHAARHAQAVHGGAAPQRGGPQKRPVTPNMRADHKESTEANVCHRLFRLRCGRKAPRDHQHVRAVRSTAPRTGAPSMCAKGHAGLSQDSFGAAPWTKSESWWAGP